MHSLRDIKTIGIVVAVEKGAFLGAFGEADEKVKLKGIEAYIYYRGGIKLVMAFSGAGEIYAAATTQSVIDGYDPDLILNAGICGGLNENMEPGTKCIVSSVVYYGYDITAMGNRKGICPGFENEHIKISEALLGNDFAADFQKAACASADRLVTGKEERIKLGREFECDICEMEAAGVLITSIRNGIPCAIIKVVSDGIEDDVLSLLQTDRIKEYSHMAAKAALMAVDNIINQQ